MRRQENGPNASEHHWNPFLSESCGKHNHSACKRKKPQLKIHTSHWILGHNNMTNFKRVEIVRLPILSISRWTHWRPFPPHTHTPRSKLRKQEILMYQASDLGVVHSREAWPSSLACFGGWIRRFYRSSTARSALTRAELEERDQELRREGYMAASARGHRGA